MLSRIRRITSAELGKQRVNIVVIDCEINSNIVSHGAWWWIRLYASEGIEKHQSLITMRYALLRRAAHFKVVGTNPFGGIGLAMGLIGSLLQPGRAYTLLDAKNQSSLSSRLGVIQVSMENRIFHKCHQLEKMNSGTDFRITDEVKTKDQRFGQVNNIIGTATYHVKSILYTLVELEKIT